MAVKTITIDLDAYELLARHKRTGESFSRVIKEHLGKRKTGRDLREAVRRSRLRKDTLDAIEEQVERRRRSIARAPSL